MTLPRSLSWLLLSLGACSLLSAQTNFYAASADGNNKDRWNDADKGRKWTVDGSTWTPAAAGGTYHTNGFQVKAGPIGKAAGGKPYVFAGARLVIDGFAKDSKLAGTGAGSGEIHFELKAGSNEGPRQVTPKRAVKGIYEANLVAAPTTGTEFRLIRGCVGIVLLNGSLRLEGNTRFTTGSINDMQFLIAAPVTGTGDIELSGGSSGSKIQGGWLMWSFKDLTGWRGARLSVQNRHTLSFIGPADFMRTNPDLVIVFSSSSPGFINLSADVSIDVEHFKYGRNRLGAGIYTAADLNALHQSKWGGQAAAPFASGKGRLFVGQPIQP